VIADERAVRVATDRAALDEPSLVLAAAGIAHRVARVGVEWHLGVDANDLDRAHGALEAYDRERPRDAVREPDGGRSYVGVIVAVLLVAFYVVSGPTDPATRWSRAGSASAERILHGEPWRTVTALTLHADPAHVAGNAVACAVFVTAVARVLGPGVGVALVLLAGAGGNALNAVLHGAHHDSVGASTAVFGAIGLLGGLAFRRRRGERRAWLPIGASLGLLAMLGVGERADLLAHLFGLLVGGALGVAAAVALVRRPGRGVQRALAVAALAAIAGCWALALGPP